MSTTESESAFIPLGEHNGFIFADVVLHLQDGEVSVNEALHMTANLIEFMTARMSYDAQQALFSAIARALEASTQTAEV